MRNSRVRTVSIGRHEILHSWQRDIRRIRGRILSYVLTPSASRVEQRSNHPRTVGMLRASHLMIAGIATAALAWGGRDSGDRGDQFERRSPLASSSSEMSVSRIGAIVARAVTAARATNDVEIGAGALMAALLYDPDIKGILEGVTPLDVRSISAALVATDDAEQQDEHGPSGAPSFYVVGDSGQPEEAQPRLSMVARRCLERALTSESNSPIKELFLCLLAESEVVRDAFKGVGIEPEDLHGAISE